MGRDRGSYRGKKIIPLQHLKYDLYVDGGLVKKNPSPYAGTWCWVLVDGEGRRIEFDSGMILPKDIGKKKVTNNVMELYAAIKGIEAMPKEWCGIVHTDSIVTYCRLIGGRKFDGVPLDLIKRCLSLVGGRRWTAKHIGGHPTKKELSIGYDSRGLQVSPHNVFCDKMCRQEAKKFTSVYNS